MLGASFVRRYTTDDFGAIIQGLLAVERALFAGETLHNHLGVTVQFQILSRRFVGIEPDGG